MEDTDRVLGAIAETFNSAIRDYKYNPDKKIIKFIKAGEKPPTTQSSRRCLLSSAPDWQLIVDLGRRLKFPEHISTTSLRPDMVLFSTKTKQVILWELTVPWEENMELAYERKMEKYQDLVDDCKRRGWKASCYPIEVGVRGFAGKSLNQALNKMGISGLKKRRAVQTILDMAVKSSKWIWICRGNKWTVAK